MVAAARGAERKPHPQWFQEVLDEGSRLEDSINAMFEEESTALTVNRQKELNLSLGLINGVEVIIRCHIDGEQEPCPGDEISILREYKKIRESGWQNFLRQGVEVHHNYPWQVSVMMHAGLYQHCEFVGGRCVDGEITEVYCHDLEVPPISLLAIKQKIAKVERLINEGYGADEVECSGSFPCPYWYLHDAKPAVDDIHMTPQLREITDKKRAASARQKELESDLEAVKEYKKSLDRELTGLDLPDKFTAVGDDGIRVKLSHTKRHVAESTVTRQGYDVDYWQVK